MVRLFQSRGAVRVVATVVLIGAMLPNVTYVGHWSNGNAETAHSHSDAAARGHPDSSPAEGDEHELHCHQGPSRCAGAQSLTGSIWVGEEAGLLELDARPQRVELSEAIRALETPVARVLQPPQAA